MNPLEQFYIRQEEPTKSCMLALRDIILNIDQEIKTAWKYGMPFFVLDGKMLCYLWKDKKTGKPYIGFADGKLMDHPQLEQGNRSRMKVLHIDPEQDIDVELVEELVKMGMAIKGF